MKFLAIMGIILVILLIWGLIGSSISADIGTTCDIGVGKDGNLFCWTWHKNIIGDIGDIIDDALES